MLNVFCLWTGHKYSIDYVTKLQNMVKENLTLDHKFICLTDKPHLHKIEGIEFRQAYIAIADSWCKLSLFVPQLADVYKGRALYLDLDVVITGKLDGLVNRCETLEVNQDEEKETINFKKTFFIIKDWWRKGDYNSSVMMWEMGQFNKLFNGFKTSDMQRLKGDQDLITELLDEGEVKTFGDIEVQSYKANNLKDEFKKHTKIVVFHGKPKPHEVGGWVTDYWK